MRHLGRVYEADGRPGSNLANMRKRYNGPVLLRDLLGLDDDVENDQIVPAPARPSMPGQGPIPILTTPENLEMSSTV
ncbi:hypothetical protein J7T55_001705 [Diaporthe amygdali]|uniref:uncharacterized protein n=1 Tax=Phomopsis amygdali TaxID=1214568 RepID=UPI0022FEEAB1|nr:uncharacterized protein J7T55_001705 [Diaporthe amygdali]KAJ0104218.1 hypothetical protein J7T55_001705 [Diaporthe amygdali]